MNVATKAEAWAAVKRLAIEEGDRLRNLATPGEYDLDISVQVSCGEQQLIDEHVESLLKILPDTTRAGSAPSELEILSFLARYSPDVVDLMVRQWKQGKLKFDDGDKAVASAALKAMRDSRRRKSVKGSVAIEYGRTEVCS